MAGAGSRALVVQVFVSDDDGAGSLWRDVAWSVVPARSKRRTVVEAALREAEVDVGDDGLLVRVLDEDSAREIRVSLESPPARLVVG